MFRLYIICYLIVYSAFKLFVNATAILIIFYFLIISIDYLLFLK